MLGWVKSKIQKATTDAMRDDIDRFLVSLQGASSDEVSDVLVMATLVRLDLERNDPLIGQVLNGEVAGTFEADVFPLQLNQLIRNFQKQGKPELAAGAMVWLHSLRALQDPQLRLLGRKMWGELERGAKAIDPHQISEGISLGHLPEEFFDALEFVPPALSPHPD